MSRLVDFQRDIFVFLEIATKPGCGDRAEAKFQENLIAQPKDIANPNTVPFLWVKPSEPFLLEKA
jgi:hypothetical protein